MLEVVLDFETASAVDLKEAGAWRYSEDITTEVLCLCYKYDGLVWTWKPGDDQEQLNNLANNSGIIFVAHNAGFEKAIWRNIMVAVFGFPNIPNSRWDDTLAACAMRAIPLDLDRSTTVLRLSVSKDKEGSAFTKKLSKPNRKGYYDRSSESIARVVAYCEQDIAAEAALRDRLGPLPVGERNVWLLDQRINERGVLLDLDFIRQAQLVVDRATVPLIAEFKEITGGLVPTQAVKVKQWVHDQGVWIDSLNKEAVAGLIGDDEDEDDLDPLDDSLRNTHPHVYRALYIRSLVGSASVKKLRRMLACVGADGRARGIAQYHAASPGRWGGRLFQPHNFPRGTILDGQGHKFDPNFMVNAIMSGDPEHVELVIGPAVESVVSSLRHAIIAAPGKVLLSGDFAGVEARTVLALAGQHDKTELMASGRDVYCDMAEAIYKRPIDKKKDPEERQTGKNSVLGLGFQMGWKKFKMKYGGNLTEEMCEKVVDTYRTEWAPKVPVVWEDLGEASLNTVKTGRPHDAHGVLYELDDRWLTARLPSGRKLWYFNPVLVKRAMPWDETDIRLAFCYQQMKMGQFKTIDAFGGLMTENVVQGLARDLMVNAMFKLEKEGFPIVLTVHDEIVCEPMAADADEKAFEQIMTDIPPWAKNINLPVAVETWKGDRYRK